MKTRSRITSVAAALFALATVFSCAADTVRLYWIIDGVTNQLTSLAGDLTPTDNGTYNLVWDAGADLPDSPAVEGKLEIQFDDPADRTGGTITIDSAGQRWPWNNKVDISYTISNLFDGHAVEYIDGGTTGYIDTGMCPTNHEADFEYTADSFVSDKHLIGTTAGASYYHFTEYSNKYYWGRNGNESNGGTWTAGKHKVLYNYGNDWRVVFDGLTIGGYGTKITVRSGYNLYIGRRDNSVYGFHKMHWLKIIDKDNSNLVRDFIPVRFTNESGEQEGAMWDRVTKQLFRNAGTGAFTFGPDL